MLNDIDKEISKDLFLPWAADGRGTSYAEDLGTKNKGNIYGCYHCGNLSQSSNPKVVTNCGHVDKWLRATIW